VDKGWKRALVGLLIATGAMATEAQAQAPVPGSDFYLLATGNGFLASLYRVPTDRLTSLDATGSGILLTVENAVQGGEVEVTFSASFLPPIELPIGREIEANVERVGEELFLSRARELCRGNPIIDTPASTQTDRGRVIRRSAGCSMPADRSYAHVFLISETLKRGGVTCSWSYRFSARASGMQPRPPGLDVCEAMPVHNRGATTTVRFTRPEGP
jgi:hypothetical protein